MLPKKFRLKKKYHIDNVFKKGDSIQESSLICKYNQNSTDISKPCFTISKKIKLNAVSRNRFRRQMIYAYKKALLEINQTQNRDKKLNYDFVFILYKIPSQNKSRFETFYQDYLNIFKKLTNKNV